MSFIEDLYGTDEFGGPHGPSVLDCTCGSRAPLIELHDDGATTTHPAHDIHCPIHGLEATITRLNHQEDPTTPPR